MKQKKRIDQLLRTVLLTVLSVLCALPVCSQVTVGDGTPPRDFSVLEVSTKDTKGGLRLPQLTTAQRNAWRDYFLGTATGNPVKPSGNVTADELANAPGLAIFNTDTKCYEYWNSTRWVSLCEGSSLMTISPEPCKDVAEDGSGCDDEFTITDPDCQNGPFTIMIVAGQDYASLYDVNEADGIFRISFQPNNSVNQRSVVVRVTSSCTGLYKDFLFLQDGHTCNVNLGNAPAITAVPAGNNIAFCAGGAVYLSIDESSISSPASLGDVIWTRNNIEIARGVNNIVVTQEGKYDVWMGYIGCNRLDGNAVTVTRDGTGAPQPVSIIVNGNNGMVCGPDGTTGLVVINPNGSGDILWFKNGVLAIAGTDYTVSSTSGNYVEIKDVGVGEWFAVVKDGNCYSRPSETVFVIENPDSGGSLTVPEITYSGSFCAGSSILLSLSSGSYNATYTYTWYENNTALGTGRSMMYTVPNNVGQVVIRCRATLSGSCAEEALSVEPVTTGTIPSRPVITGDRVLCSGKATLNVEAVESGAYIYTWYKGNENITIDPSDPTITVTSGGDYYATVTSGSGAGCTSPRAHINLSNVSSAAPVVTFNSSAPTPGVANTGDIITYNAEINFGPALSYTWTTSNADIIDGGGLNDNYAVVRYGTAGSPAYVQVVVTNSCGAGMGKREVAIVGSNCEEAVDGTLNPGTNQNKSVIAGVNFTLGPVSVSFGSAGTSYQWYRNTSQSTSGSALLAGKTANSLTTSEPSEGTFYYYCVMKNSKPACSSVPEVYSPFYIVTVSSNPATMERGSGTLSGKTCFDINKSNWTDDCGTQVARASVATDFATLGAVTYSFTASASGTKSNLRFQIVDPLGCVVSYAGGKSGTINNNEVINLTVDYKLTLSNNNDIIYGRTRDNAARVTIYAIYNDGTKDVSVPLEVKIQDCVCCGAFVAAGVWKAFMCHNLGADESLDPFIPAKGLNGNYYQWGRPTVVATVDTPEGAISGWNTTYAANGSWTDATKTTNDPCPPNYRIPTNTQWGGVINTSLNAQSVPSGASWTSSATNFTSGRKFGNALYLPAAGYRSYSTGQLGYRGNYGYYWSSTQDGTNHAYEMHLNSSGAGTNTTRRTYGQSVRCIAE